jgi:hypothetical protein
VVLNAGTQVLAAKTKTEGLRAVAVSQESEVADLDEADRQDAEQETADKFDRF